MQTDRYVYTIKMGTEVFLVRHAQSHVKPKLYHSQWPLSLVGQAQAEALASLLENSRIERVFSSPFRRCIDTMSPLAGRLGVSTVIRDGLRERLQTLEFVYDFNELMQKSWDNFDYAPSGCETSHVAQRRIVSEITALCAEHPNHTLAVCSHGNVIGLFLNQIDPTFLRPGMESLKNPDVLRIVHSADGFHWDREFVLKGLAEISTDVRAR